MRSILTAVALVFLAGCIKVVKPTSDSTPPALVWNVFNHADRSQADHPATVTLDAKRGDMFRVILKATDPEGVKSIQINPSLGSGEAAWQCRRSAGGEDLAQNKTATLKNMTQNLAPDAQGKVLTSIFLIWEADLTMACTDGSWTFASGSYHLTGSASNYFGGVANGSLTFKVTQ